MGESKSWITPFMKQCFVSAGVSLNMGGSGLVVGFTTGLLKQLGEEDSEIPLDESAISWIASIPGLALILGNCLAPTMMTRYGRKNTNLLNIIPLIIGWILIYFAKSLTVLYVARFLQGLSMGICTSVASVLIGEYTSPRNRGLFLMSITVTIAILVMCVHTLGSYLTWRYTAFICGIIALIDLFIVIYSPESPSWLCSKGRYEACEKSFRWLRGNGEEEELKKMIEATMEFRESKISTKSFSFAKKIRSKWNYVKIAFGKKEFYKPVFIMIHIFILGQWNGINVLVAFPINLFDKVVGKTANMPLLIMSIDIHRIVANTLALIVVKKIKRRTLLYVGVGLNIVALLSVAAYTYAFDQGMIAPKYHIVGILLVHLHMFTIATGSLPLGFILAGEIYPLEYRNLAGLTILVYSLNMFLTMKTTPLLLKSINVYGTYLIYAAICSYCLVVACLTLPETKDRTLQDIEDEFRGRPLSPEEMKSIQSLASFREVTNDRRCSTPMAL